MGDFSSVLGSVGTGATIGGTLGTAVPVVGNAVGAVGGALIGLAGGLWAYYAEKGETEKARSVLEKAQRDYGDLSDESIAQAMGDTLPPSELASIKQDPRFADAQNKALASLQEIGSSGGLTAADRAARNEANNAATLTAERARQASLQGLSRGGLFGSGAAVEQAIQGQQQVANTASQQAQNELGRAQQRSLDAISRGGDLAGQLKRDDWNQKSDVAKADDERERALWGNRQQLYRQQVANGATKLGFAQQGYGMDVDAAKAQANMRAGTAQGIGSLLNSAAQNYRPGTPTPPATGDAPLQPKATASVAPTATFAPNASNDTWKPDPYGPPDPNDPRLRDGW